jgi:toxin secretion/phage lysis holin
MRGHFITSVAAKITAPQFCIVTGAIGSLLTHLFGGWDMILEMLVVFMVLDYLSGLAVAGIYKKSKKTKSGGLSSKVGWKGLCRKCMTLAFVVVAHYIDTILGVDYIRSAVIVGFATNELISIIENAGAINLPLPKVLLDAVELLKNRGENAHEN